MRRDVAFFNVDTQQACPRGRGLVFRERVAEMAGRLARLIDFARRRDFVLVWTACVNAGPVRHALSEDTLFIGMDDRPDDWAARLPSRRVVFLEKRTCGSPAENVRTMAYEVFHANPNANAVIRAIDIPRWAVFGDSAEYCLQGAARALMALGREVVVLGDAVGKGTGGEQDKARVLESLARDGAEVRTVDEFLADLDGHA